MQGLLEACSSTQKALIRESEEKIRRMHVAIARKIQSSLEWLSGTFVEVVDECALDNMVNWTLC